MSKKAISPAAHARLREQLSAMLKQISAGEFDRVDQPLRSLVRKYPAVAEVNHVASGYFGRIGSKEQAIYYAQRALDIEPAVAEYHLALGTLRFQIGQHQQAADHLLDAIKINPDLYQAHSALGVAYLELGQYANACAALDRAIEKLPESFEPRMNRALLESDIGHASNAVDMARQAIEDFPNQPILHDSLAMFSCYDDRLTPEEVFAIHKEFGRCMQLQVRVPRRYPHAPDPEKRIRIGFVSSDFKTHSIAYFVEPIFANLDHDRFELCVYSTGTHRDEMTDRLKAHTDLWRDCHEGVAKTHEQIVKDRVDVLVELNGHFASNSLPIFAAKPTPVSITMIGYANTTGLETIDARFVDDITDPAPWADQLATEKLVRIADCFLCYQPSVHRPEIESTDPDRPFTFGSFNDLRKVSPSTIGAWTKILEQCPSARLVLKTGRLSNDEFRNDLLARFEAAGAATDRITLMGRTESIVDHLGLYKTIDCALDTFPYTGTTTTCEAMSMGVPTITLMGQSHAGRVSASLLSAIGRAEFIADSVDEYIAKAVGQYVRGLRTKPDRDQLCTDLDQSPLADQVSYTKKFQAAVVNLWAQWCDHNQSKDPKTEPTP